MNILFSSRFKNSFFTTGNAFNYNNRFMRELSRLEFAQSQNSIGLLPIDIHEHTVSKYFLHSFSPHMESFQLILEFQ